MAVVLLDFIELRADHSNVALVKFSSFQATLANPTSATLSALHGIVVALARVHGDETRLLQ